MAALLECVPNFSEGRNPVTIDAIRESLSGPGVTVLDVQSDTDHNRSVFTLIGAADDLMESVFSGIKTATELVDLRRHEGAHPRVGATDVVPFVPLLNTTMEEAVAVAHRLGERVASELRVPVYFYEDATKSPERRNLEKVRGKGFEELREVIEIDETRAPDLGPRAVHPSAGAVIIGARRPLIAYNIYLGTKDVKIAQEIARTIRHSTGGLRYVKALGFEIPERGCVQVSMNLTNFSRSSMASVFEMVKQAAESHGVLVTDSEIVGMVPAAALFDAARHYLRMHDFSQDQVLEVRLLENQGE
jgi:glutamate formiminotransferase / 5-formyltetrahydrofolate cyclo-ligase